jgi:hypothetical protein
MVTLPPQIFVVDQITDVQRVAALAIHLHLTAVSLTAIRGQRL